MPIPQVSANIYYFLPLAFLFYTASLFSQTNQQDADSIYIIREISYIINGKTRETALERMGGFKTGEQFIGLAELDSYISEKMRELNNIRALESENNAIFYSLGEAEADGTIPVLLSVSVSDSINLIFFPVPKYDSNVGLKIALYLRDFNFLGNLALFSIDLFWVNEIDNQNNMGFEAELSIPFQLFSYNWMLELYNEFTWFFYDNPTSNTSIVNISMELPVSSTVFTLGLEQGFVAQEENTDKVLAFEPDAGDFHDFYLYTKPYILWYIPTPIQAGSYGQLVYIPGIYGIINYQPGGDVGDYRKGPGAGINQEISLERIDWHGNFRQGIKLSLTNNNEYNFFRQEWINTIGMELQAHFLLSRLLGFSTRLLYTKWFNDYYEEAGDVMRGYKDNELETSQRLSLNLDLPFRLIRFVPSEWTGNNKLRYLDFEQHWSPFIDLLVIDTVDTLDSTYRFVLQDLIVAAGLEIITYPLSWRSFYIRGSIGWNMNEWFETKRPPSGIHREIYLGVGHYY